MTDAFAAQLLMAIASGKHAATAIKQSALPAKTGAALKQWLSDNNLPDSPGDETSSEFYVFTLPKPWASVYVADFSGDSAEVFSAQAVFYEDKLLVESIQVSD